LLLNEQATHANVTAGLAWLNNSLGAQPKPGDRVYIYLSGHGDAYDASEAYYLCYDSNPAGDKNNYQLGGALDIGKMKKRVAAMVSKGVEVVLIVDACRSGDVPGVRSGIGNPYQSVIEEPAGEVLLLSAGPNQFALEDRRWGGGHGGFTWYLIKGLSGEADVDGDGSVSLFEIESYTKMRVIGDTKQMGAAQTPYVCCNNKFDCVLSKKDELFSKRVREEESGNTKVGLTALAARDALEKAMFEKEELKQEYFAMKKACKEKRYLGKESAWEIWERCKKKYTEQEVEPLRIYLMGALAAEGQKAINEEINVSLENSPSYEFYRDRRLWVDHAIQLQKSPSEVMGIENLREFIKALELDNGVKNAFPVLDSVYYTYQDEFYKEKKIIPYEQADSIFRKLETSFNKSAVYYYLLQDHLSKRELFYIEDHSEERKKYLRKAMELAPNWPKPLAVAIVFRMFAKDEIEQILTEKINSESDNPDNYYLNFIKVCFDLPIDRKKQLENLEKAFYLRPSTAILQTLLQEKYANYFISLDQMMNIDFDQFYTPSKQEWESFEKLMNDYYSGIYHGLECALDSTSTVRTLTMNITAFAVRSGHADVAWRWLELEEKVCPSYDAKIAMSILAKYVKKDLALAHQLDKAAQHIHTGQESTLNFYGVDKDKIPKEIRARVLYQCVKSINLIYFAQDDWCKEELRSVDTLITYGDECNKLSFSQHFALNQHLKTGKTDFEKWNEQMNELRRVDRPELFPMAAASARFHHCFDSLTIFLRDEDLSGYLETNPSMSIIISLLDGAQNSEKANLDSLLNVAFQSYGGNEKVLANVLCTSVLCQKYRQTNFFKEHYAAPVAEVDQLIYFQLMLNWELYDEMEQAFASFPWQTPGKISSIVLTTLILSLRGIDNPPLIERMLNVLIPYIYNSSNQDYSIPLFTLQQYLFVETKKNEPRRNAEEFKRVKQKYCVQ
jgi:hypothetical protein